MILAITACTSIAGCSDDAVPAARAPAVSAAARQSASARLVAEAQAATSPAALAHLLAAMEGVGGPEIVAYCLALAENESAPAELRKGALAVLVRWADRNDPALRARSAAIWERVNALPPSPAGTPMVARGPIGSVAIGSATLRGGMIANATPVVAGMAAGFRRCYAHALRQDAGTRGVLEVTASIDAAGVVSSMQESHTGLTPGLVSCILAGVQASVFASPQGGSAIIVIPIRFDVR